MGGERNVEDLFAEYIDRLNAGEPIEGARIREEHPDLADELLPLLEDFIDAAEPDKDLERATVLGDYTLRRQLGRGGMGVVYEAWQQSMDRVVALKVLPPGVAADDRAFQRFMQEAKTAGKLNHQNVVSVHSTGVEEGTPWYSMEYVDGETLAQILAKTKGAEPETETPFGPKDQGDYFIRLARAFADVADGLQHAHSKGVVHRDIKPSNLILDGGDRLRILDFGLARLEGQESLTASGDFVGTPLYMSPEQARRKKIPIDHRTDVYSLGATMYEAICGRPPFRGKDHADTLSQIIERDPVQPKKSNPRIPEDLQTVVLKCLRKDSGDRYGTAEALAQDLRRFGRGDPIEAKEEASWQRLSRFAVRHRRALLTTGILLLLALFGASLSVILITQAYHETREAKNEALKDLYVADMRMAKVDWETGNFGRFVDLLNRHRPAPGEPDLRRWEWYYLQSLRNVPRREFDVCPEDGVQSIAWSPNGHFLASGSGDGKVRIWNVTEGEVTREFVAGSSPVRALDWNPVADELVAVCEKGTVRGWNTVTADELFHQLPGSSRADAVTTEEPDRGNRPDHTRWFFDTESRAVAWSRDGSMFAAAPGTGRIEVCRGRDGSVLVSLPEESRGSVSSLCWSVDGKTLVAAVRNPPRIVTWETKGWNEIARQTAPGGHLYGLALSRDGSSLASAHNEHWIAFWDADALVESTPRLRGAHEGAVLSVDWRPDGTRLASGGQDGLVQVWNVDDREEPSAVFRGHSHVVRQVRWSPDGSRLASASQDGTVKIWDPAVSSSSEDLSGSSGWSGGAVWSRDGRSLAIAGHDAVKVIDVASGEQVSTLNSGDNIIRSSFAPEGDRLAAKTPDGLLVVWDWRRQMHTGRLEGRNVSCFDWSPDGTRLATGGQDGVATVRDAVSLEVVRELGVHDSLIGDIAWSPDGSLLAATSMDAVVKVWETREWKLLHQLHRLRRSGDRHYWTGSGAIAWSPGSDRLAVVGSAKTAVVVWQMPSGAEVRRFLGHASGVRSVAWGPDGRRLATGGFDSLVKVWDSETGDELLSLQCESWGVVSVEWHPDGDRLLSVSKGGQVRIWDARPGYGGEIQAKR